MNTNQNDSASLGLLITAAALGALALFFYLSVRAPLTATVVTVFAIVCVAGSTVRGPRQAPLEIDDEGLFDPRLGVGKILWRDVRDFYVEENQGNRFLCLQVERPERFVLNADRSLRDKFKRNHELGFRRLNVDVKHIDLCVQELHKRISRRVQTAIAP